MNKRILLSLALCLAAASAFTATKPKAKNLPPYKNASLSTDARVADLLSRMTLEEKVGQLRCTMAWNYYEIKESGRKEKSEVAVSESFRKDIDEEHIGMLWATFRADPWTQKSLANGLTPALAAKAANALQRYAVEQTRLGIPLFLAEEAPHGHMAIGATVFPTGLGMAATWSPELSRQAGEVIGKEVRLQGGHISYGPVLDLAREPRWSRVEETMGEDPCLTAQVGSALVSGLGGGDVTKPYSTIATLKHFIAYGASDGGQNGGHASIGLRALHEDFLPPFRAAIKAGALSVMTSYNAIDGLPATSDRALLTDLLRTGWHFRGFVVSDLFSIDGLAGTHRVAASRREAGTMALDAGVDVDLGAQAYRHLIAAVREGEIPEAAVDTAVARVLRLKFEMGLFENPYVEPKATTPVGSTAHRQAALDAARASVTLLKNGKDSLSAPLPLAKDLRVLVCGPNADSQYNQLGDYTAPQADDAVTTVLEGIRAKLPAGQVEYVRGCAIRDTTDYDIAAAVAAARRADVVVCCVGGSSARDFRTSYEATGAATVNASATISDMECGEGFDRATLDLLGRQQQLLEALRPVAKRLVVVYIEGRPLDKRWAAEQADALLTAYYPGGEGGTAIADVLFGDYNPAGRLPVSVPRHVGQLPVYYNHKAPSAHDYVETTAAPLYPFGYGLSYTTFDYSGLTIDALPGNNFRVRFTVTNTGQRDGEEVAQLYISHTHPSVVQPRLALKAFKRVAIAKGQAQSIELTLTPDDLSIVDRQLQRRLEPEDIQIIVGSSSADIKLKGMVKSPAAILD